MKVQSRADNKKIGELVCDGRTEMTLRELIQKATHIYFAGICECGERKFDLDCGDNLAYEPVHESAIKEVKPELLEHKG